MARSNTTRSQNDIMSYLRRVGKSVKYATIDFVKEQLPISTSIIENNVETVKEAVSNIKNMKNDLKNTVQDSNLSYLMKAPDRLISNAKKDLKSGDFHHPERDAQDEASLLDGMVKTLFGSDLADMFNGEFDEEDEGSDDEYPVKGIPTITKGEATIAAITSVTSKKAANSISKAIITMGEANKKTLQNIATIQYQQTERQNVLLQHGFSGLTNAVNSIIEFNNEIIRTHVENSRQFYESTSNLLNENNAIFKELLDMQRYMYSGQKRKDEEEEQEEANKKSVSAEEIFKNGFDLKAYYKHVKQGAEKNPFISMAMMMVNMVPMMISDIVNNPIEFLVKQGLGTLVGAPLKTAMRKFDATLGGSIKTGLARLADFGATDDSLVGQIARIFGFKQKETALREVDTSKYNKGAMSWNGVAQKALVEVIPGYLRRIEASLSGQGERIFDFDGGKWMTANQVRKLAENEKKSRVRESTQELRQQLNYAFAPYSNKLSRADMKQLNKYVDEVMTKLYDVGYIGNIDEMLSASKGKDTFLGVPTEVAQAILTAMRQMDSRVLNNFTGNVANSKAKFNQMIQGLAENGGEFGSNNVWMEILNNSNRGQVNGFKGVMNPETLAANPVLLQSLLGTANIPGANNVVNATQQANKVAKAKKTISGVVGTIVNSVMNDGELDLGAIMDAVNNPEGVKQVAQGRSGSKSAALSVARAHQRSAYMQNSQALNMVGQYSALDINKALGGDSKELKELLSEVTNNLKQQRKYMEKQEIENNKTIFDNALDVVAPNRKALPDHIDPKAPLSQQLLQAASLGEKFRVMSYNINKILDSPAQLLTSVIGQADKFMYEMLFTKDTGTVKDENGKEVQVKGLTGRMIYELKNTFSKANNWIDEKLKGSATEKLAKGAKTFAKDWLDVDVDNLVDRAKSGIHTFTDPLTGGIKGALKGVVSGASSDVKRTISGIKGGINSLSREDLLYAGEIQDGDTVDTIMKRARKNRKEAEQEAKRMQADFEKNQGQFAFGAKQVKRGGLAFISPGEAIIPADLNPWNPNRNKVDRKEQSKQEGRMKQRFSAALDRTIGKYINVDSIPGKADGDTGEGLSFDNTNFSKYYPIFQFIQILRSNGVDTETITELLKLFGYNGTEADFFVDKVGKMFGKTLKFMTGKNADSPLGEMAADFLTRTDFYRGLNDESKRLTRAVLRKAGYKGFVNTEESIRREEYNRGSGVFNGINQFSNAAFGTDMDLAGKKITDFVKKNTPEIAGGGAVGALLSLVFPLGGPLMGAVAGAAANVIAHNKTAMEYIFGKDIIDAAGNVRREEGIIPDKMVRALQKYVPDAKAYGITGALAGLFTPFGPLGGMMLGVGASIMKNNATLQTVLFGEKGGLINKNRKALIKKAFPRIAGATLATLLLGPMGVVGNAMLGSAIGLISTTDSFKNIMLGHKDSRGIRQGGLAGAIRREISDPLKRTMRDISDNLGNWFRDKIFKPIGAGLAPMGRALTSLVSSLTHGATNWLKNSIAGRFMDRLFGGALAGVRRAGGAIKWGAKKIGSGAAKIASGIETVGSWIDQDMVESGLADTMDLDTRVKIASKYKINNKFTQADYAMSQMTPEDLRKLGDAAELMYYTKQGGAKSYLKRRRGTVIADYQGDLERLSREQLDAKEDGALTQGRIRTILRKIEKLNKLDDYESLINDISNDNKLSSKTKRELIKILNSRKENLSTILAQETILKDPEGYKDSERRFVDLLGLSKRLSDKDKQAVVAYVKRTVPNQLSYINDMYDAEYGSQVEGRLPGEISKHDALVANLDKDYVALPNAEDIKHTKQFDIIINNLEILNSLFREDKKYSKLERMKMALQNPAVANDIAKYEAVTKKGELISDFAAKQAERKQEARNQVLDEITGDIYSGGTNTYVHNLSQDRLDDIVFHKSNKNKASYLIQGFKSVQDYGDKGAGDIIDADALSKLKDKESIKRIIFLTLQGYTIDPSFYQDIAALPKASFFCVQELAKLGVRFDDFNAIAKVVKDDKDTASDVIELAKVKLFKDSDTTIGDRLTAGELAYKVSTAEFNMFKNRNRLNPTGSVAQGIANAFDRDRGNRDLRTIGLDKYFSSNIDEEQTINKAELEEGYDPQKAFDKVSKDAKAYNSVLTDSALAMKNLTEETNKLIKIFTGAAKALAKVGLELPAKAILGSDNVDLAKSMGRDINRSLQDWWQSNGESDDSNELYVNKLIDVYGKYHGNKMLNDLSAEFGERIYNTLDKQVQKMLEDIAQKTGNKIEDMVIAAYVNSGRKLEGLSQNIGDIKDKVFGETPEESKDKYKERLFRLTVGNELYFKGSPEEKRAQFEDWFENEFWPYDKESKASVYNEIKKQASAKRAKVLKEELNEKDTTHASGLWSATKDFVLNDISSHIRGDSDYQKSKRDKAPNDIQEMQNQSAVPTAQVTEVPSQGFTNPNAINTAISTGNAINGGGGTLGSTEQNGVTNVPTAEGDIVQFGRDRFGGGLVKLHNKENYEIEQRNKHKLDLQERSTSALEVMAEGFKYLKFKATDSVKKGGKSILDMFKDMLKLPLELLSLPLRLLMMIPGVGALLRFGGRLFKFLMQYGINIFAQSNLGKSLAEIFSKFMGKNSVFGAIGAKLGLDTFTDMAAGGAKTATETAAKTATSTAGVGAAEVAGAAAGVAGLGAGISKLGKQASESVIKDFSVTGNAVKDRAEFEKRMTQSLKASGTNLSQDEINKVINSQWESFSKSKEFTDASSYAKLTNKPVNMNREVVESASNKPGIFRRGFNAIANSSIMNTLKTNRRARNLLMAGSAIGLGAGTLYATSGTSEAAVRQSTDQYGNKISDTTATAGNYDYQAISQQQQSSQEALYKSGKLFDPRPLEREYDGKFTPRALGTLNGLIKNHHYGQKEIENYAKLLIDMDVRDHPNDPENRVFFIPNSVKDPRARDAVAREEIRSNAMATIGDKVKYNTYDAADYTSKGVANNATYVANGVTNNASWLSKKGGEALDYFTSIPGMVGAGTALLSKFVGKRGTVASSLLGASAASIADAIDNLANNPDYGFGNFLGDTASTLGTGLGLGVGAKGLHWLGKHVYRAANNRYVNRQINKDVAENGVEKAKSFGTSSPSNRSIINKIPILRNFSNKTLGDIARTPTGKLKIGGLLGLLGGGAYLANDYYNSVNTRFRDNQSALQGVDILGSQYMPNVLQSLVGGIVGERLATAINPKLGNSKWGQLIGLGGGTLGGMLTDENGFTLQGGLLGLLGSALTGYGIHRMFGGTEFDNLKNKYKNIGGANAKISDLVKLRLKHAAWAAPLAGLLLANKYGYTDEEKENLYYQGQTEGNTLRNIAGSIGGLIAGNAVSNTFLGGRHKTLSRLIGGTLGAAGLSNQDLSTMSIMSGAAYTSLPLIASKIKDFVTNNADPKSDARKAFDAKNRILPESVHNIINKTKAGKWLPWLTTAGLGAGILYSNSKTPEEKQAEVEALKQSDTSYYMGNENKVVNEETQQATSNNQQQSRLGYFASLLGSIGGGIAGQGATAWLANKYIKGNSKAAKFARFMAATTGGVLGANITDPTSIFDSGIGLAASIGGSAILNKFLPGNTTDPGITGKILDKATSALKINKSKNVVEEAVEEQIPKPNKPSVSEEKAKADMKKFFEVSKKGEFKTKEEFDRWFEDYWQRAKDNTKPKESTPSGRSDTPKPKSATKTPGTFAHYTRAKDIMFRRLGKYYPDKEAFDKVFDQNYKRLYMGDNKADTTSKAPSSSTVETTTTKPTETNRPTPTIETTKPKSSIFESIKSRLSNLPSLGSKGKKILALGAIGTAVGAGTLLSGTQKSEAASLTSTIRTGTDVGLSGKDAYGASDVTPEDNKGLFVDKGTGAAMAIAGLGSFAGGMIGDRLSDKVADKIGAGSKVKTLMSLISSGALGYLGSNINDPTGIDSDGFLSDLLVGGGIGGVAKLVSDHTQRGRDFNRRASEMQESASSRIKNALRGRAGRLATLIGLGGLAGAGTLYATSGTSHANALYPEEDEAVGSVSKDMAKQYPSGTVPTQATNISPTVRNTAEDQQSKGLFVDNNSILSLGVGLAGAHFGGKLGEKLLGRFGKKSGWLGRSLGSAIGFDINNPQDITAGSILTNMAIDAGFQVAGKGIGWLGRKTGVIKPKQAESLAEMAKDGIIDKASTVPKPALNLTEKAKTIGNTTVNTIKEKGIEQSAKLKSLLGEIKNGLQAIVSKLSRWISGKSAKAAVQGFVSKLLEQITKPQNLAKAAKKVAAESAAAVGGASSFGLIYGAYKIGEAIMNFLSGYNGADEMLKLKPGTASTGMKVVAGLVTAICGCIPFIGAFIPSDFVLELAIEYVGPAFGFGKKELDELRRNADKKEKDEAKATLSNSTESDGFAKQLKDTAKGVVNTVIDNAASMTGLIADKASKIYETAKNAAKGAYNWVKDTANAVGDWISTNASKGAEWLANKASSAVNTAGEILHSAGDVVSGGWNYLKNSSIGKTVSSVFGQGKETYNYLSSDQYNSLDKLMEFSNAHKANFGMGGTFYSQLDPQYDMSMNVAGDQIPQSMRDSGCGPMSAANALSKLGIDIDPREATQYALDRGYKERNGGIRPEFFKDLMSKVGVDATTVHDQDSIKESLRSGNPVILMGKDGRGETKYTPFAENPHYVTATGLDNNGNIIIQDPESNTPNKVYKASDVLNKSTIAVTTGMGRRFGRGKSIISRFGKSRVIHSIISKFGRGGDVSPEKMWALANWASGKCQVDAKLIYAQWYHESGAFSSQLARENYNFGGMTQVEPTGDPSDKQPDGGNYYMHFGNPEEWAEYYAWYINRCDGCAGCTDPATFATALKANGYFGDSVDNYINGLNGGIAAIPAGSPDMSLINQSNFGKIDPGQPTKSSNSFNSTTTTSDPTSMIKSGIKSFTTILATAFNPNRVSTPTYGTGKHFGSHMYGAGNIPTAVSKITHSYGTGSIRNTSNYIANTGYVSGRSKTSFFGRGAETTSTTGTDIPETIWNFLRGKGLSETATAAIMGNIQAESSYNPANINPSSGAKGLCQWYKGRAQALDSYAASKGGSWEDVNIQLNYLWDMEIGPGKPYNQYVTQLDSQGSLDAAVEYWEKHFEVSGDTDSYPRRKAAAKEAFDKKGKGIKGEYTGGSSSSSSTKNGGIFGALDAIASGLSAALNPFASFANNNNTQQPTSTVRLPETLEEKVQQTTDINRASGNTGANPGSGEAAAMVNNVNILLHGSKGMPIVTSDPATRDNRTLIELWMDEYKYGKDEKTGKVYTEEEYNAMQKAKEGAGKHSRFGMGKYGRGIMDFVNSGLAALFPDPKELQKKAEENKAAASAPIVEQQSTSSNQSQESQPAVAPNSEEANNKAAENPQNPQPTTQTTKQSSSVLGKLESMATTLGQKVQGVMSKFGSKIMKLMPMFGSALSTLFGDNNPIFSIFGFGGNQNNSNGTTNGNLKNVNMDIKGSTLETLMSAMPNEGITSQFMDEAGRPTPGAHGGIDIATAVGTEVPSPVNGIVSDVGFESGYGNYVQIKDSKGNFHIFAHLSEQLVSKGQQVKRGDIVAKSGNTGNTSGPHLHYQIDPPDNEAAVKGGAHLNPATYSAAGLGKHSRFGMGKYGRGDINVDIESARNVPFLAPKSMVKNFNQNFGISDAQYKMAMFGRGATPYARWNKRYGRGVPVINNHSVNNKLDSLLMDYSSNGGYAKQTNIAPTITPPTVSNREELNAIIASIKENNELVKQNNQLLSAILQLVTKAIASGLGSRQAADTAMNTNSRQKGVNTAQSIKDQLSIFGNGSKYGMGDRYGTDDSKGFESIINTINMIASR